MPAKVQVLTLLSKTHQEKGRYVISFEVVQKKKADDIKKKRKSEEQVYVEHDSVAGGCSPEIELPLTNRKCQMKLVIGGALKPHSELEEGEDTIEYNESLSECRKLLTLVPTYDANAEGTATIKFKVEGTVKHTVTVHDVPVTKEMNRNVSSSSSFVEVTEASRQTSLISNSSFTSSFSSMDQSTIDERSSMGESVREDITSASGEGHWIGGGAMALGVPARILDERMAQMTIRGPDVVPPEPYDIETAYDKILCNESLNTLSWVLSPADASRLLIGLGVPDSIQKHNLKNHQGDIVTSNYESFRHWKNQRKSRRQQHEASNKDMYEDLLYELGDMGRNDLKVVIKRALELNKKMEKNDFSHL